MLKLYVCGPYNNPDPMVVKKNIENAKRCADKIHAAGIIPVCPHIIFERKIFEESFYYRATAELMLTCDAVCVVNSDQWKKSKGCMSEINIALSAGMMWLQESCLEDEKEIEFIINAIMRAAILAQMNPSAHEASVCMALERLDNLTKTSPCVRWKGKKVND